MHDQLCKTNPMLTTPVATAESVQKAHHLSAWPDTSAFVTESLSLGAALHGGKQKQGGEGQRLLRTQPACDAGPGACCARPSPAGTTKYNPPSDLMHYLAFRSNRVHVSQNRDLEEEFNPSIPLLLHDCLGHMVSWQFA